VLGSLLWLLALTFCPIIFRIGGKRRATPHWLRACALQLCCVAAAYGDVAVNRAAPHDDFMDVIVQNLMEALETMIVYLAASNVTDFGNMHIAVGEHPQFGQGHILKSINLIGIGYSLEWHPLSQTNGFVR
jgi:hypothetical protein